MIDSKNVELVNWTENSDDFVYRCARICYSKNFFSWSETPDKNAVIDLINHLKDSGHMSPFEHVSFTFAISGISRVATHQLVRHRIASFSQQSQRYVENMSADEMAIPSSIENNEKAKSDFIESANSSFEAYKKLIAEGVKAEDARYLLPHGMKSKIVVTMNARSLDHFFTVRLCKKAQEEIREYALVMRELVLEKAPAIFATSHAPCAFGKCGEKKPCGDPYRF